MDLLRWWRFLAAVDISWDKATSIEGRDFARWMQITDKPARIHWRRRRDEQDAATTGDPDNPGPAAGAGASNPVTGKPRLGSKYAPSTRAHAETVLRSFYDTYLTCLTTWSHSR